MKTIVWAVLVALIAVKPVYAVTAIVWEDLKDPAAARIDDPFDTLLLSELRAIAKVYRLRKLLEKAPLPAADRAEVEKQLAAEEQKLAAAGVEADILLAQREAVAEQNAKALAQGNPELSGREVAITGYVIPVIDQAGSAAAGYLVPEYGMCSHVPPPPPNQMIRYRLGEDWTEARLYKPVMVRGLLHLKMSRQTITLLDGPVTMVSAFDMDVTEIRSLDSPEADAGQRSFRNFTRQSPPD